MKRLCSILITLFVLFTVCSCNQAPPNADTPDPAEQNSMSSACSKDSVDEFLAITGHMQGDGLLSGFSITEENLYNVTPPQVSAATDVKIFKASDSCASFILIDNEIYSICESFGGYGFVNAVPCDFDQDGHTDLLVASSWGSGLHRSIISVFNVETKESTVVYDTATTDDPPIDLFVTAETPSTSSSDPTELPTYYRIYSAEIKVNDNNAAKLSYVATDMIGTVEYENGAIVFKPASK